MKQTGQFSYSDDRHGKTQKRDHEMSIDPDHQNIF